MPTGRTLLLADDSPTVQKVVSLTFDDEGFTVIAVGGGSEALEQLGRIVPDVVLADVHMPAPGGYELCERIKRDARTRHVPVMLLVGAFEPFDEAEARRVGADEVLTKPFQSIRDLVNKVGGMLGGQPDPVRTDARDAEGAARGDDSAPRAFDPLANERASDAAGSRAFETSKDEGARAVAAAPAFADFGVDDEGIETATPDEFAARSHTHDAELAEPRPPVSAAPKSFAATASSAAPRTQTFESRADAAAAADDALLELGDFDSPIARDTSSDDFVLDMGDADAYTAPRAAAAERVVDEPVYAADAYADDAPSAVETMGAGSLSMAEPSVAWDDAEEFAVSPEAITEPVQPPAHEAETTAVHFDDEAQQAIEARGAATSDESAPSESKGMNGVASVEPGAHAQLGSTELSPEAIDAIARRVVEHLSERVVREIAWEVVPDLAERLIRRKLAEEETRSK
ncbi:MAG: PleD family two-component system response regulator [Pyrinomonadaceae bacterium]